MGVDREYPVVVDSWCVGGIGGRTIVAMVTTNTVRSAANWRHIRRTPD